MVNSIFLSLYILQVITQFNELSLMCINSSQMLQTESQSIFSKSFRPFPLILSPVFRSPNLRYKTRRSYSSVRLLFRIGFVSHSRNPRPPFSTSACVDYNVPRPRVIVLPSPSCSCSVGVTSLWTTPSITKSPSPSHPVPHDSPCPPSSSTSLLPPPLVSIQGTFHLRPTSQPPRSSMEKCSRIRSPAPPLKEILRFVTYLAYRPYRKAVIHRNQVSYILSSGILLFTLQDVPYENTISISVPFPSPSSCHPPIFIFPSLVFRFSVYVHPNSVISSPPFGSNLVHRS